MNNINFKNTIRETNIFEQIMKNIKPYITLIFLIIILFFAIKEKQTTIKIINNLLYQDEILQTKTIHH